MNIDQPQQHIASSDDYLTRVITLNGATHIQQSQPTMLDNADDSLIESFQRQAENLKAAAQSQSDDIAVSKQADYDDLFPSEKRIAIERHYTPLITKLSKEHEAACDAVSEFENDQDRFRSDLQARFAFDLKHPDVKTVFCSSDTHLNEMLKTGHLHISGYKLCERRSSGGFTLMVGDAPVSTPTSSTLVFIPVGVESLMSYAHSTEALDYSKQIYDAELQRLITRRKAAAVKLTEAKQKARAALDAIPTFEQLISDAVKRAKK